MKSASTLRKEKEISFFSTEHLNKCASAKSHPPQHTATNVEYSTCSKIKKIKYLTQSHQRVQMKDAFYRK